MASLVPAGVAVAPAVPLHGLVDVPAPHAGPLAGARRAAAVARVVPARDVVGADRDGGALRDAALPLAGAARTAVVLREAVDHLVRCDVADVAVQAERARADVLQERPERREHAAGLLRALAVDAVVEGRRRGPDDGPGIRPRDDVARVPGGLAERVVLPERERRRADHSRVRARHTLGRAL